MAQPIATHTASTSRATAEHNAILDTIQDYIDGANGNMEVLRRAYHPNSLINGQPIQALFDSVARAGETSASARIDNIDRTGAAASAKVIVEDWHGNNYVEYLHLIKQNGSWQIISKAFDHYAV